MSPLFHDRPGRARKPPLLGAFLVLTLLLAAWLGYEALAAAGSHRATAESVLRDYAEISLSSFSRSASDDLGEVLEEAFEDIDGDLRTATGLPDPRQIAWDLDDAARAAGCRRRECPSIRSPLLVFALDLETGALRVDPDTVPPAPVRQLAQTIRGLQAGPPWSAYTEGLLLTGRGRLFPDSVMVGYGITRDSLGGARVMGFAVEAGALGELFAEWFDDRRLLPDPIGGDLPNDSLLQVTVRAPDGRTVYASPVDYPSTLSATGTLGPEHGGLAMEVALRPDRASQLIIGGLPSSRIPLLLTLLLLTLGVGGAALVQFRREVRFQRLREDFVSGVSHELRTPLAQIRMFGELQDSGKLSSPEDRKRANAVIHRESRRLSHLVENILQFSRFRYAGGPEMLMEDLDLAEALEEGVDAMGPLVVNRSMSLRVQSEADLWVRANRQALTRVVVNLLDNAVKHGPEGQEITLDARRDGESVRLVVEDGGPGVPPSERRRIWKAYHRLDRDVKARLPGTGIGLAVVLEVATAHGGRVWVEESAKGGARFVLELPLVTPPSTSRGPGPRWSTGDPTDGRGAGHDGRGAGHDRRGAGHDGRGAGHPGRNGRSGA